MPWRRKGSVEWCCVSEELWSGWGTDMQPTETHVHSTNNALTYHAFLQINVQKSSGEKIWCRNTKEGQGFWGQTSFFKIPTLLLMSLTLDTFSVLSVGILSPSSHRDWRIRWLNASQVLTNLSLHMVRARWRFNARITIGKSQRFLVCGSEAPPSLSNISKARKNTFTFLFLQFCSPLLQTLQALNSQNRETIAGCDGREVIIPALGR